jgi:hypothetical protein
LLWHIFIKHCAFFCDCVDMIRATAKDAFAEKKAKRRPRREFVMASPCALRVGRVLDVWEGRVTLWTSGFSRILSLVGWWGTLLCELTWFFRESSVSCYLLCYSRLCVFSRFMRFMIIYVSCIERFKGCLVRSGLVVCTYWVPT